MSDEIQTFIRRKQLERDRHKFDDLVEAARPRRAQKRFQLRERHFDRIEVGTVWREKSEPRAGAFNRRLDFGLFVRRQVIEDDDIARAQAWDEDLLDVREERGVIDRAVEDRRCHKSADA